MSLNVIIPVFLMCVLICNNIILSNKKSFILRLIVHVKKKKYLKMTYYK